MQLNKMRQKGFPSDPAVTASVTGNTVTITSNIRGRLLNFDETNLTYGGTNRAEQVATATKTTFNLGADHLRKMMKLM